MDATLIHPESYELAEWLLTSQGFSTKDIGTQNLRNHFLNQIDIKAVKKAMVDENIYSESKSQEISLLLLFLHLYFSSNSLLHFFGSFSEHNDIDKGENNLDQVIEALQMELFADIRNSNPERKVCRVIYFIYLYIYVPIFKNDAENEKKRLLFMIKFTYFNVFCEYFSSATK